MPSSLPPEVLRVWPAGLPGEPCLSFLEFMFDELVVSWLARKHAYDDVDILAYWIPPDGWYVSGLPGALAYSDWRASRRRRRAASSL